MSGERRLRLELAPSPAMAAMIVGLHAIAGACVLAVLPGVAGVALSAAFVALGLATAWARALLRSAASVRAIELQGALVQLELASGERFAAELSARRHAGKFSVMLPVLRPGRRTILVSRDMLSADSFRLLRIWALWGKLPGVAGKQLPA